MKGKRISNKKIIVETPQIEEEEDDIDNTSEQSPVDSDSYDEDEGEEDTNEEESVDNSDDNAENESDSDNGEEEEEDDEDFERQSSSDESGSSADEIDSDEDSVDLIKSAKLKKLEVSVRNYRDAKKTSSQPANLTDLLNTDDLSSDDEEATGSTIGRVPLHWYDAYDHIGYNIHGEKIVKRKGKDRIDQALANRDDPSSLRTVYDMYNDREVVLSERDLELIQRIQSGMYAHAEHDDTPDYIDYFSSIKEIMPLSARPEPKHKFLPSKWELLKVKKILKAMRDGTYKTIQQREDEKRAQGQSTLSMIWDDQDEDEIGNKRSQYHLPAPKIPLPGHAESYNPPPEYLLTGEEQREMEDQDPSDRQYNFIPTKYDCLRHVPGYTNFVKERFERCLDLYLCPRKLKLRLNIDPETLMPRLPKPRELKPYPNTLALQYLGHTKAVRSITVSPDGQYLVSGSDDGTVRLWEVDTCLCRSIWTFDEPVLQVAWNPNYNHHIVAVVTGKSVVLISTGTGDRDSAEITDSLLEATRDIAETIKEDTTDGDDEAAEADADEVDDGEGEEDEGDEEEEEGRSKKNKIKAKWIICTNKTKTLKHGFSTGPIVRLLLPNPVTQVAWHYKGDYFATLSPGSGATSVCIHQVRYRPVLPAHIPVTVTVVNCCIYTYITYDSYIRYFYVNYYICFTTHHIYYAML